MPDYYSEPFITLAGLTHNSALISWGAFYFRVKNSGEEFKLVDDDDLDEIKEVNTGEPDKPRRIVHPPRSDSIGAASKPYGPARVEVEDVQTGAVIKADAVPGKNHCLVVGLKPDTEYTYRLFVNSDGEAEPWADGPRRNWERRGKDGMGLGPRSKAYVNRFRTFPDPSAPARPFTFAVIGDFGVGIKKDKDRGQRQVAAALELAINSEQENVRFVLTTGDNIYRRGGFLGLPIGGDTGDEDDDWYFTFYQPYRYLIDHLPVYPTAGNHDGADTEANDDRAQLADNFHLEERFGPHQDRRRASLEPGLFYRFDVGALVELVCVDTTWGEHAGVHYFD
ncbi:MAG: metallophosphoesterase, partial [Pyrinomonadaceae bacterium]